MKNKLNKLVTGFCAFLIFASQQIAFPQEIGLQNAHPMNKNDASESQPVSLENILLLSKSKLAGGEILLMNSSHQDLAWMDFLEKCIIERDTMLMTPLLKAASKDPGYRFDIEDVLMIKEYIGRHPDAKVEIIRMLKDGRLSCGSTYQMPYEEMYSGESLVRQFYLGARWVKENLDGYFPDTYWNPDVPGRTMQMAQIMSKSGIRNLVMSRHDKGVYRWYSPDGSFVYAYSPGQYGDDFGFLRKKFPESSDILAQKSLFWDKGYNTKIDVQPVVPVLSDYDMSPARDYSLLISQWNSMVSYRDEQGKLASLTLPKIRLATAPEFIEKIVRSSPDLKKITGERPAVWLYIHGPSHEWALKASREGDIMMTNAEKFSTIDALLQGTFRNYPEERLKKAWEAKIYPDHGWGGKGGESTDAIFLSKFNESLSEAKSITDETLKSIASKIRTNPRKGIPVVVFNSLSWKRDDPVSFKISFDPGKAMNIKLTDEAGKEIPVQLSDIERYKDNSLKRAKAIFVAREIPSIGYKTYYVVPEMTAMSTQDDNQDEISGAAGERYTTNCSDVHPRGIENWIGASDDKFGVTLSTSTSVADYIDPAGLSSGALLLQPIMLASRRSCHRLGNEYLQTGNHYFHFSLTSHKPGYENGYKFGKQSNEKLLVVVDPQAGKFSPLPEEISFFSVDASNVSVSTIKKAEDDNDAVIRLFETGMGETRVHLNSWFKIVKAEKTNLLEYEGKVIESKSNIVPVNLGSHAIETIKLVIN